MEDETETAVETPIIARGARWWFKIPVIVILSIVWCMSLLAVASLLFGSFFKKGSFFYVSDYSFYEYTSLLLCFFLIPIGIKYLYYRELRIYSDRVETTGFLAPSVVYHSEIESIEIPASLPTQVFINIERENSSSMINFGLLVTDWLKVVAVLVAVVPDTVEKKGKEEMWDRVRKIQKEMQLDGSV